jgi:hypothetical protein
VPGKEAQYDAGLIAPRRALEQYLERCLEFRDDVHRLEQLDRVARRVVYDNLLTTNASNDIVSKRYF